MSVSPSIQPLQRPLWSAMLILLALVLCFGLYVYSEKQVDRANDIRHLSYLLADELRESSHDLTRMARLYVVTGAPRYKAYYQEIIAIRDGRAVRPYKHFHAYWDLLIAGARFQLGEGTPTPLLELIRKAHFTAQEQRSVEAALSASNKLTQLELEAMRLAERQGGTDRAAREQAVRMLHDEAYHQAKAAIMTPLNDVFDAMDLRTAAEVAAAERRATVFRGVFLTCTLAAIFLFWRSYRNLRSTLGGTPEELHANLRRIGEGDLSGAISVPEQYGDSVMAEVAVMQDRLRQYTQSLNKAEADLRAMVARLNEAQRIAGIGSWTLYLDTGKLFWSDEIYRIFEIDQTRFGASYDAFLAMVHPDDREAVNRAYLDSLETRQPYEITHRLLMEDGRIKWVQEKCTTDFDPSGAPLRSQGTVQDVTERIRVETQLRIAAAAFESQEGMIVTDAATTILRVNRAFCELTGYAPEEVVGQTPRLFKSGRHTAQFYRDMWDAIITTGGWQGEIWDRRKDGQEYQKWLTISSVRDGAGVVTHYIGAQYDITQRKQAEERINELAFYDQLTGLPNRTLMRDRLKQAMAASQRTNSVGALFFIDLDNFKALNDTMGHDMGDLLLRQVGQRLTESVREVDTVSRLGGDEFVVTLTSLSSNEREAATHAESVAIKIITVLNQPFQLQDTLYQITPSIGITLFQGHESDIETLLKQADLAMYKAKDAGRNTMRFFDPDMEQEVMKRVSLERDLREAIRLHELELYYQAQVTSGYLTGAEALVRWKHPERGMITPAAFIPLAEETGLILPLGLWVLEAACAQLAVWAGDPVLGDLVVAVNVSVQQFRQADFVDQVREALAKSGAPPHRLKLELTESLFVSNVEELIEKMVALRSVGVTFSLDDFGTGYSSLSNLKRLPLDQLKIDQSFVRDVLDDPNDAAIAATVVALGKSLGLMVIAEGVETPGQRDFLAQVGCYAYQGYLFSRPLPLEEFEVFALGFSQRFTSDC